jgi:hypothetical protein
MRIVLCPWLTLQAKLQRAVELVVHVLSPTNGSYEPFKVEPGGSARLKVVQRSRAQANSAKTSGAPAKHKVSQETMCELLLSFYLLLQRACCCGVPCMGLAASLAIQVSSCS